MVQFDNDWLNVVGAKSEITITFETVKEPVEFFKPIKVTTVQQQHSIFMLETMLKEKVCCRAPTTSRHF